MSTFRKAYSIVGALLILEYLAQFYLIATALFTLGQAFDGPDSHPSSKAVYAAFKNADSIAALHVINGYFVIPVTTLVLIGLSFASRYSWKTTAQTSSLLALLLLQIGLVWLAIPGVAALHALNAIVIVATGSWIVWNHWAWRTGAKPAEAPKPVEEPVPLGSVS
jgi:hypothetical protein